jgi:hypothetical protein
MFEAVIRKLRRQLRAERASARYWRNLFFMMWEDIPF